MSSDKISKRLSDLYESLKELRMLLPGDPRRASEVLSDAIKDLKDCLEDSLRMHIDLLDLAPVLIRDMDGRIALWSTVAEKMYGWSADEALGKKSHDLLATGFPCPMEEIKSELMETG